MVAIQMDILSEIDLGFCIIKYYDNGIFHIHHKGKSPLTLEKVKLVSQKRLEFTNGERCLVLATASDTYNMPTKEVDDYLQSYKSSNYTIASAFVTVNFPQRLAIKAMETFHKTNYPTAGFDNIEDAVEWLLEKKNMM